MVKRLREAAKIRDDALKLAVKKGQAGCLSCMESYLQLAHEYGANEEELLLARKQGQLLPQEDVLEQSYEKSSQRRQLLKLAARGGIAAAAGALSLHSQTAEAQESAVKQTTLWGTDSVTAACCGMPQNFYIGRIGYGTERTGDGNFFNMPAASRAGRNHTYGYWGVLGPDLRPAKVSAFDWGRRQADCAWNARNHGVHARYIGGLTVFADLEPEFGGWQRNSYMANRAVVSGFLQELFTISPHYVWPGLYSSPLTWRSLLGQQYRPTTDFVLWLTGSHTCTRELCSPCNPACKTLPGVQRILNANISRMALGGRKPVVWQYWINSCGCGDYNVMTQNAPSLRPVNSRVLYAVY